MSHLFVLEKMKAHISMRGRNKFATPPSVLCCVLLFHKTILNQKAKGRSNFSCLVCALSEAKGMGKSMNNEVKKTDVIGVWSHFKEKHPGIAQFAVFFLISNGVTVIQIFIMPLIKYMFGFTSLVSMNFQVFPVGHNFGGSIYYVFDYAKGSITNGGGGGLAYFLAVEITLLIAQVINFFLQRNVTFKSNTSVAKAAVWYGIAWVIISVGAAALQGLYKSPIYEFCMKMMGQGLGIIVADLITIVINCAISFWVFFPIMKVIFKQKKEA